MLTRNTQAILLLTAPLLVGRRTVPGTPLRPAEYRRFARRLRERGYQPADLLSGRAGQVLEECAGELDPRRLRELLGRGVLLATAQERWSTYAIRVFSRADAGYPSRWKKRLKEHAPAVVYVCGEPDLLERGGLAVLGSRRAEEDLLRYSAEVGALAAGAGVPVISGGARGVDRAAMEGALGAGGTAVGVLSADLARAATRREYRIPVREKRLVLVSPYDPFCRFTVWQAMQRNKLVYALADAALVVHAEVNRGGTWAGAVEQLGGSRLVPVYVRSTGKDRQALAVLEDKGALPWPNPDNPRELVACLRQPVRSATPLGKGEEAREGALPFRGPRAPGGTVTSAGLPLPPGGGATGDAARVLRERAEELIADYLAVPRTPGAVAEELGVRRRQAERWIRRMTESGKLEKRRRPTRYVAVAAVAGGVREEATRQGARGERLFDVARRLIRALLAEPRGLDEVARELDVLKAQAGDWIGRLERAGEVERRNRPRRWVVPPPALFPEREEGVLPREGGQ